MAGKKKAWVFTVFVGFLSIEGWASKDTSQIELEEHSVVWEGALFKHGPKPSTIIQEINNIEEKLEKSNITPQARTLIANAATYALFKANDWQPWDQDKITPFGPCFPQKFEGYLTPFPPEDFQKKGPDHGIDALFEKEIEAEHYLLINESKFRLIPKTGLELEDFGFLQDKIQQSSSTWNQQHLEEMGFEKIRTATAQYKDKSYHFLRTATFLNDKGEFKLYFVKDKNDYVYNREFLAGLKTPSSQEFLEISKQFKEEMTRLKQLQAHKKKKQEAAYARAQKKFGLKKERSAYNRNK